MIVVDSSAIVAILENEPDAPVYAAALRRAERLAMSAVNLHECGIVIRRRHGLLAAERLWNFIVRDNDFEIVPFDLHQARLALRAYDRYGKGIDARAGLNLCDCAAFALAVSLDCPLLFKGDDFVHTEIRPAL